MMTQLGAMNLWVMGWAIGYMLNSSAGAAIGLGLAASFTALWNGIVAVVKRD
jgi:hypothetical protein